jgi:hypothetical protein
VLNMKVSGFCGACMVADYVKGSSLRALVFDGRRSTPKMQ